MYQLYQIFILLLKLDTFFIFGFCLQILLLIIQPNDIEFALTVSGLPITLGFLITSIRGVKREDKAIMWTFMIYMTMLVTYFTFKLIRIWTQDLKEYSDTRVYLTLFCNFIHTNISLFSPHFYTLNDHSMINMIYMF